MNIFKIAYRSLQFRGVGSLLTIISMALGIMLVVGVLTIYGVVERSFKSNSSFGYDVIVGARGGSTQLMLNTVFYLSKPVENIPYEYYLAFRNKEKRQVELKRSIAYNTHVTRSQLRQIAEETAKLTPFGGPLDLFSEVCSDSLEQAEEKKMGLNVDGKLYIYTDVAVPIALGDYFNEKFRVVGTTPEFFSEIVLDIDTGRKFEFSDGRAFEEFNATNGFFEAVVGSTVARETNTKVGDIIYPIHGDPNSQNAHIHEQGFTVVGILKPTGTANDRVAFTNLEGHFLMEDHAKPMDEKGLFGLDSNPSPVTPVSWQETEETHEDNDQVGSHLVRTRLPIEQREVTAILIRSYSEDEEEEEDFAEGGASDDEDDDSEFITIGMGQAITAMVDESELESTLEWSAYRPARAQRAADAISPVYEVTSLFENFVSPIRWLLLVLTTMICVVSGISILVGIYNSMAQRQHEIAVMRALGAGRFKVMSIMLMESLLLALCGGMLGWVAGHTLNMFVSPFVEHNTGVTLGFFNFAPPVPFLSWIMPEGIPFLPGFDIESIKLSPEFLLIPGLILLAVVVGIYPAISAYRTDVSNSLSK